MFEKNCPLCGEELVKWHGSIYECEECRNMIDIECLEESE